MFIRSLLSVLLMVLIGCSSTSRAPVEERYAQSLDRGHIVAKGETLYSIAFRYGLDYRKVAAANGIDGQYTIYPGQRIVLKEAVITPVPAAAAGGSSAQVSPAISPATVLPVLPATASIAATPQNRQSSAPAPKPAPAIAQSKPQPQPAPEATAPDVVFTGGKVAAWAWPAAGRVTRGYSVSVHKGIDIGGARGDPVVAAAAGKVVYAGTGIAGLGELLIIKHNEVYLSAYAHNERLLVKEGAVVKAGEQIAQKGSSGTDTVKLHFEIRKEGKPIDPQRLLPKR